MNDNQNEQIDYNQQNSYKENKKRKKKQILIISIIIVLIIILLIIILLFSNNGKETSDEKYTEPYHGKWKCNENIELEINSKGFVMDYGDKGYIEATYIVDSIKKESKYNKYILNVSATKRIIDGEEKKGDYTTQYEIVIDESNNSEMAMANTITSSMYICYKNNSQKQNNDINEQKSIKENHYVIGTSVLGYIAVPKAWTYTTDLNGEYIYINENIEDLSVNMGKYSDESKYVEILDMLRKESNKVIEDDYVKTTKNFEESESKVGKYDATLFKIKEENMSKKNNNSEKSYFYYWIFEDEGGIVRYFSLLSKNEDLLKEYMYIVESYSLTKY